MDKRLKFNMIGSDLTISYIDVFSEERRERTFYVDRTVVFERVPGGEGKIVGRALDQSGQVLMVEKPEHFRNIIHDAYDRMRAWHRKLLRILETEGV